MKDIKFKQARIRDVQTNEELPPRAHPGYYPGFSTLAQMSHWDNATRQLVEKRLAQAAIKFFTAEEALVMQAVLDCLMPQSDRDEDHQIPVLALIDDRLYHQRFEGYIFEGTVADDVAHRLGLAAIAAMSQVAHKKGFAALNRREQETILMSIRDGNPGSAWNCAPRLLSSYYWNVLIQDAVSAYYAHPFAWDEIGFGGPAYPRGYMRLTDGLPEPWEKDETRYQWLAPIDSRSDEYSENTKLFREAVGIDQS